MSNAEFDNYLALIGKLLQLTRKQQDAIGSELRDHLESRVADLLELGVERNEAIRQALEEFGDAALMAKNLQFVSHLKRRRWIMRFATFSIAGCFFVALLAMAMWPENARFGAPDRSLAQNDKQDPGRVADSSLQEPVPTQDSEDPFSAAPQVVADDNPSIFQLNESIERALDETIDLDYEEVEWSSIRRDLFERLKINVITDQTALEDGLPEEEILTVKLCGLPLDVGLKHMLKSKNATTVVKDGALMVISMDCECDPEFLSIRTFDCRELIKKLDLKRSSIKFENLGSAGMQGDGMGGGGGIEGVGGGMFRTVQEITQASNAADVPPNANKQPDSSRKTTGPNSPGFGGKRATVQSRFPIAESNEELLTYLVMTMTSDADNWNSVGSVKVVNGLLIVRNKRETLNEVELFLKMLELNLNQ